MPGTAHTMPAIEAEHLTKRFGDVIANDALSLSVKKGSVHGIVGENGAGKSTLLKMLFGFYKPDAGTITVNGTTESFKSPADAMSAGVGMVHQHFMLVEPFTVLENILLGAEESWDLEKEKGQSRHKLHTLQQEFGFDLPLDTPVSSLPVGVRQRVEILKALYRGADILILDEPTAVLTPQECDGLFDLVKNLKASGKTVLFVTHKLHEVMAITDHVTVIRAGKVVAERQTAETSAEELAELMVGAKIVRQVNREDASGSTAALQIKNVSCHENGHARLKDISLTVNSGEIVGVAGVAGNGQTELLEAITGLRQIDEGSITFGDKLIAGPDHLTDPLTLRRMGMAHIAEDRLKTGVVSSMTAEENILLGYQSTRNMTKNGLLRPDNIKLVAEDCFDIQDVRPRNPQLPISSFSGGNQQKIVIARELERDPSVLVIGQPTRGVDIGAVTKIHDQLVGLRNAGKALLVVSADLDELMTISDRIAVMCDGRVTGVVDASEADEKTLGLLMAGAA